MFFGGTIVSNHCYQANTAGDSGSMAIAFYDRGACKDLINILCKQLHVFCLTHSTASAMQFLSKLTFLVRIFTVTIITINRVHYNVRNCIH